MILISAITILSELPEEVIGSESDKSDDNEDNQSRISSYGSTTHLLMVFLILWGHLLYLSNAALNVILPYLFNIFKTYSTK